AGNAHGGVLRRDNHLLVGLEPRLGEVVDPEIRCGQRFGRNLEEAAPDFGLRSTGDVERHLDPQHAPQPSELLLERDAVFKREIAAPQLLHESLLDRVRALDVGELQDPELVPALQQSDLRRECGHARPPLLLRVAWRSRAVERYRTLADSGAGPATGRRGEFTEGGTRRLAAYGRGIPYR